MNKNEIQNLFKNFNGYQWSMKKSPTSKIFNNGNSLWTKSKRYNLGSQKHSSTGATVFLNIIRICEGVNIGVVGVYNLGRDIMQPNIPFAIAMSKIM